ncbi:MAG: hemerythrin family protein [Bacteroidia bacterium]|nr:hemerythrin family protein [Bacteroidia bacterium]
MKKDPNLKISAEDYLFNIMIVDEQHQRFIGIYNNIIKLSEDKPNVTNDKICRVLNELSEYLKYHFKTEERLMMLADYPDIDKHIKEHIFFINKIDEFILANKYKNPVLLDNMLAFSRKWFLSHIMQTDAKYIDILKAYIDHHPDTK